MRRRLACRESPDSRIAFLDCPDDHRILLISELGNHSRRHQIIGNLSPSQSWIQVCLACFRARLSPCDDRLERDHHPRTMESHDDLIHPSNLPVFETIAANSLQSLSPDQRSLSSTSSPCLPIHHGRTAAALETFSARQTTS